MEQIINNNENKIFSDVRKLIEQGRQQVAVAVNAGMTLMYWHIGERINREVLGGNEPLMANRLSQNYRASLPKNTARALTKRILTR